MTKILFELHADNPANPVVLSLAYYGPISRTLNQTHLSKKPAACYNTSAMNNDCLFCRIINKEIPAEIVYEDDNILAFRDIAPQAPVHILIIPKEHIPTVNDVTENKDMLLGTLIRKARDIASDMGMKENGYRIVLNCNKDAGQEVFHIHVHLLGGRKFSWPPG